MIGLLSTLRKLVLGETWLLPGSVAAALALAAVVRALAGPHGWWSNAGGFVLLAGVVVGLLVTVGSATRAARRPPDAED